MANIDAVKTFIAGYSGFSGGGLYTDKLYNDAPSYSIDAIPSENVISRFMDGSSRRQFQFAIRAMLSTSDEAQRLNNCGGFETFAAWLETKTQLNQLPNLGTGKTAETIYANNTGFLQIEGESESSVYQIICTLVYKQAAQ